MKLRNLFAAAVSSVLCSASMASDSLLDLPLKDIYGRETTLRASKPKAVLVVNVASQCGYTGQYAGLEALWQKYKDKGLVVAGFPCNDFGGQEPGSAGEIKSFCKSTYNVTFPLFEKVAITGTSPHPLFKDLIAKGGDVGWNFTKFLVSKDGATVTKFEPDVEPASPMLIEAVEAALKQ